MQLQQTEHQLQTVCMNFLKYKGYYCFRMNSGAIRSTDSRGKMYLTRLHQPGTPDVLAIKNGIATFFEIKIGKNKPTTLQLMKMQELEEYGAKCFVIHSLEELQKVIQ